MARREPELFTAVAVVYVAQPKLAGLAHVAQSIDAFLDSARYDWTLESVIDEDASELDEAGVLRLLDRLLVLEWPGLNAGFRMDRFLYNVQQAGQKNKMRVVDWWLTKYLPPNRATVKNILQSAINWNRVHVLKWLQSLGIVFARPNERLYVECRHAEMAYWLHDHGYLLSVDVEIEIGRNNMAFMTWLYEHRHVHIIRDLEKGVVFSASINSVEMAQWLIEMYPGTKWDKPNQCMNVELSHQMVQWLENFFDWKDNDDPIASVLGETSVSYGGAHERWVNKTVAIAAKSGNLEVVKCLYNHPLHQPSCNLIFTAAESGHLEIVKWLHEMEPLCSDDAIGFAAKGGHFDIVKWLHEQTVLRSTGQTKRPWIHEHGRRLSIDNAAENGSLELVQWLHTHRPDECSAAAMERAASSGHLHVLQWLHANRTEGCTADTLHDAICEGHLGVIQWMLETPIKCEQRVENEALLIDTAAAHGRLDIVQWLHEKGSTSCSKDAVYKAAQSGYLEIVKYLLENRSEGCTRVAIQGAASYGYFKTLKYIIEYGFASCADRATRNAEPMEIDDEEPEFRPMDDAVEFGYVQVVKFLFEHCHLRCSESAMNEARYMRYFAALEWVLKNDPNFSNFKYKRFKKNTATKRETRRYLQHSA